MSASYLLTTKIVYSLKHNDFDAAVRKVYAYLPALDDRWSPWIMSFCAKKSEILIYRCSLLKDSVLLRRSLTARWPTILDRGLNYPASLHFSEQVVIQSTSASLIFCTMQLSDSALSNYETFNQSLSMALLYNPASQRGIGFPLKVSAKASRSKWWVSQCLRITRNAL